MSDDKKFRFECHLCKGVEFENVNWTGGPWMKMSFSATCSMCGREILSLPDGLKELEPWEDEERLDEH